jgi:hypothetical protein
VNTIRPVAAPGAGGDAASHHVALASGIDLPVQKLG